MLSEFAMKKYENAGLKPRPQLRNKALSQSQENIKNMKSLDESTNFAFVPPQNRNIQRGQSTDINKRMIAKNLKLAELKF